MIALEAYLLQWCALACVVICYLHCVFYWRSLHCLYCIVFWFAILALALLVGLIIIAFALALLGLTLHCFLLRGLAVFQGWCGGFVDGSRGSWAVGGMARL